jgi:proline dehydrogenase
VTDLRRFRRASRPRSGGVIRTALLRLSRSRRAARAAGSFPGFRAFSRRFVAGSTLAEAAAAVHRLYADGFLATVSFLGENTSTWDEAEAARDEYLRLVDLIAAERLSSGLSVKLTQLGLTLGYEDCRRRLDDVVAAAEQRGLFVRIDMEHSAVVDATLSMYRELRAADRQRLGVVIQSYLRRSAGDMESLVRDGASIRLVKGAYLEPPEVAFQHKQEVDENYRRLVEIFASQGDDRPRLAVATHDDRMVDHALSCFERRQVPHGRYEFQMIYGIRGGLQRRLRDAGQRVRIYVPYGDNWYPYLVRRLAERPANLVFFLRNVFRA